MIRLTVPGMLAYRDVVLRVVASSCKLVRPQSTREQEASREPAQKFVDEVVSAVSEVFNNIALHGYGDGASGEVEIEIEADADRLTIRLADCGNQFDYAEVTRNDVQSLPESGMGLFIVRSFVDEVAYEPAAAKGERNLLTLTKRHPAARESCVEPR